MAKIGEFIHKTHTNPATLIGMKGTMLDHDRYFSDPIAGQIGGSGNKGSSSSSSSTPTLMDDPRAAVAARNRAMKRKKSEMDAKTTLLGAGS